MTVRRLLVVLAVVAATVFLVAGRADAHAVLEASDPQQGQELQTLPAQVTLQFGESVTVDDRSLEVLSPQGKRVDSGSVVHPRGIGADVAVAIPSTLPHGSYTVVWRVISADSHPVAGTYSFGYGVPAGAAVPAPKGSRAVGVLNGVARFGADIGLVLAGGVLVFAAVVWPGAWGRRRVQVVLVSGLGLLAVSSAALFLLAGPYDAAAGLAHLVDGHLLDQTWGTRYGKLVAVRLLVAVLALVVLAASRRQPSTRVRPDVAVLGVVGLLTFSLSQHAGVGTQVPFATVVDVVHLLAVTAWVGGLVVLLVTVLDGSAPAGTLRRWSRLALGSVVLIVASGTYASWREIGTFPALPETAYGRLVLVKIGLLVLLVGLGWFGRRRTVQTDAETASVHALRRSVATEVVLATGVLAVAAVLVDVQPGRETYDPADTMTASAIGTAGDHVTTRVHVDTTRPGRTSYAITVTSPTGRPLAYQGISALLADPADDLGPVRFTLPASTTGRGTATGVVVPGSGHWQLELQIRTDAFTSYAATTTYLVR